MVAEPLALAGILAAAWLYWRGLRTLVRRAQHSQPALRRRALWFALSLLSLGLALESPLDSLSGELFAIHMVQHLFLIVVAAPLLVFSAPLAPILWGFPRATRHSLGKVVNRLRPVVRPAAAFLVHSLALWIWHVPALYDAALLSRGVHILEHLSFLLTAVLFWWSVRHAGGGSVLYVLALALESGVLGALLTFADGPWYTAHLTTTSAWGLTPLEDQQIAGLIMWVPGGVIYLAFGLVSLGGWLKRSSGWSDDRLDRAAHRPAHR